MTDGPAPKDLDTRLAEERTDLAVERTREAAERTLMAWIRTCLAMIGFGFGTFKLFEYLVPAQPEGNGGSLSGIQLLTGALVAWGTLLLIGAIFQYRHTVRRLKQRFTVDEAFPLVLVGAAGMALFGLLVLTHLVLSLR